MKTRGSTWKAYLNSWPVGQWFDDSNETFDGKKEDDNEPADAAEVVFSTGVVYATDDDREGISLVSHFRKWLKAQAHITVMCQIPTNKLEEFTAVLKSIGGNLKP